MFISKIFRCSLKVNIWLILVCVWGGKRTHMYVYWVMTFMFSLLFNSSNSFSPFPFHNYIEYCFSSFYNYIELKLFKKLSSKLKNFSWPLHQKGYNLGFHSEGFWFNSWSGMVFFLMLQNVHISCAQGYV